MAVGKGGQFPPPDFGRIEGAAGQRRCAALLLPLNFVWSHNELCQFLRNDSVMSLMEDHEEEQIVTS